MAGNSEVCSHVAATLFAAQFAHEKKGSVSCTDVRAVWPVPKSSTSVPIVPINEMDFGKLVSSQSPVKVPSLTKSGIENLLSKLQSSGHNPALMRIVEPFASKISECLNKVLPCTLNFYNKNYVSKTYTELIKLAKSIDFSCTQEQQIEIEKATQTQHSNKNWYLQRAGRITASKFKLVCRTNKKSPSLSLVKSICYPTKMKFSTAATIWGLTHEHIAVKQYEQEMDEVHDSFVINDVGFLISLTWPQFGASPDRLVYCECCLGGCLEIKCPYLLHINDIDISDYVKLRNSCLVCTDNKIMLDRNHSYFYQVQMQLFVANVQYCDFVIWSPKVFFRERIFPDFDFWNKNSEIAIKFHSDIVMPELLGQYFTRKEGAATVNYWCKCKGVDDGTPMIKCDQDICQIGWFHFKCVGLSTTPDKVWLCEYCKNSL